MYGDLANKLVIEAKRATALTELPLYQHELVWDIVAETADLNKDVDFLNEQHDTADDAEATRRVNQCQLFVTHLCMRRNKRCLLAYEKLRADAIAGFAWLNVDAVTSGDARRAVLDAGGFKVLALDNLSHAEMDYYKQYQQLMLEFKSGFADVDLLGTLEPPLEIFIDVRVLKDGGEVQTEYGVFNLIKDSQLYVRKSDVERLIQQGYVEEI